MSCDYCGRPGARPLHDEVELTGPETDEKHRLRPIMCPTCELLVFPWLAAADDEHTDLQDDAFRLRGLAQTWIQAELVRVYLSDTRPQGCWWCHTDEAQQLPITQRSADGVEFVDPVLCFPCQGLLHMVGGGFANQDEAELVAEQDAAERVLRASRARPEIPDRPASLDDRDA